jgi:Spy/CpxP family protein refolding chaperone
MKRILISMIALIAISLSATAQVERKKQGHHQQEMKHHHGDMIKSLNLTDAQKQQAKANTQSFKQKMQELNKNENITVKEYRDRKEALHKEQKAQMQNLLTADQKAKMQQLKTDRQAKQEEHFAKHLNKMKTTLSLTDAQVAKMKTNRQSFREKLKAIKENDQLSRTERKEKMMALKKERKEQMDSLLSKEQKEKLQERKKHKNEKVPVK